MPEPYVLEFGVRLDRILGYGSMLGSPYWGGILDSSRLWTSGLGKGLRRMLGDPLGIWDCLSHSSPSSMYTPSAQALGTDNSHPT